MLCTIKDGTTLQAEVVRPMRFNAKVARQSETTLGVKMQYTSTSSGIFIKAMSPGCIEQYNSSAPEEYKVKVGDYIVDLNGLGGNGRKMATVMKDLTCSEMDFSILRLSV